MIKVYFFYFNKNKYYSSYPIINNLKILFDNKDFFRQNYIEITPFINFIDELDKNIMMADEEIEKLDEFMRKSMEKICEELCEVVLKYERVIFLCFHPKALDPVIKKYDFLGGFGNIFVILWQDDLQAFYKNGERIKKLDYCDLIITPSPVYFENIAPEMLKKTKFLFYSMDFNFIKECNLPFWQRYDKILLSGCVNNKYKIRKQIFDEIGSKKMDSFVDYLEKPKQKEYFYDNEVLPLGINYYKILSQYKGAFFGYYDYPMNFNLAKIIEILAVGCIGFFEESPLLEKELGLIAYRHYIPCTKGGGLITKKKYYMYFMGEIGEQIAKQGRRYVMENYSNEVGLERYKELLLGIK